jgi:predicted acetyltransferase
MAIELRTITEDELTAYRDCVMTTFGEDLDVDPDGAQRIRALLDLSRVWAAFDGATIVATAATHDLTVVVPGGGTLPMAGLTMVVVRPTHRRRGLLRELIRIHLDDARRRTIPVSGLWASESSIYGRFGYGLAAEGHSLQIDGAGALGVAAGRELDAVEWIDEARAREVLPAIYARAIAHRPGALVRSTAWWRERRFMESPWARGGASRRRHVLAVRGGELVGYVQFRQRPEWVAGLPDGAIEITELLAVDGRAEATLWRFACSVDLFPKVTWSHAPVDDLLVDVVADRRRVARRRIDTLWLRIEDVAAALAARSYQTDGVLRLSVDGEAWELAVEHGVARCTPAAGPPELRLSRASLGALFLGGTPAVRLARAELVHGDAAAIATADRLFASAVPPWCPEVF